MNTESQSSFARRHGVTRQAVAKAIQHGRFSRAAIARDERGRWVIIDSAVADREWDSNANPFMRPAWHRLVRGEETGR